LQDSFEQSNDNTNVVNARQEPFVVKQDPGANSSQSPPQINHHCCYECGDQLEDIFCHQCTCKLCGKGAHYGYNCPLKVPVIPDPEPFNNQTNDELPQTLPSFDPTCCSEYGNLFTYDSTSNLVHDSLNVFNPPLQPPTYSYEFCENNAYYGHDCSLQFPVIHQPIYEKTYAELLAEKQEANIDTQPFQYSVVPQPPQEEMSETILEIELAFEDKHCQPKDILELFQRLHNDEQNIHKELAMYINTSNWDHPTIYYDDDAEDYAIAVTPKSNEFIKSSVESLVLIPSESEGIPDNMCDVPFHDNSPPLDVSKDQFEDFSDSNDESTSNDDDSFSIDNIEYVEESSLDYELVSSEVIEIVVPEVGGIDDYIFLTIKDDILCDKLLNVNLLIANIEALNDNPAPSSNFMTKSSSTSLYYDDDDDEEGYNSLNDNIISELPSYSAVTPTELVDSLSMGDEHLDTISATKSNEVIKSSVREKIYSNPLFDEEIIPMEIDSHSFNAESDLIESLPNHDSSVIISLKIDSLFDEFAEIHFAKRLLYDNSSPRPPEEIDLYLNPDDPMPSGIEEDDDDSKRDMLILEELLDNYSLSLPANELYHFDIPSPYRPPAKPPDEKSPYLLSHLGLEAFQPSAECPMMINGKNTPVLDVPLFHLYPLDPVNDFYEFSNELAHIISPPEYDCFCFKNEPNAGDFTMDVVDDVFPTREPRVHNALPTPPTLQLNLDFILSSESLFAYVVWIFLLFSHIQLLPNIFYPLGMKIPFLIPATTVIISLLLCWMYLIGVELSKNSKS
nr:hypothetical protein [Tanacetum cinerariifolium]